MVTVKVVQFVQLW